MALTPPRTPPTSIPSTPNPNGRPSSPTPSNTPLPTPGLESSFPVGSPGSQTDSPPARPGLTSPGSRKGSFRNRISSVMRRNSTVISAVNAFAANLKDKDKDKNSDKDSQKERKSRPGSLSFSGRATPSRRSSESQLREAANAASPQPPTSPPVAPPSIPATPAAIPATPAAVDLEAPVPTNSTSESAPTDPVPSSSAPPSILEPEPTTLLPSPEIQSSQPASAPGTPKPRLDRSRLSVIGRGDYMMPSPVAESPMREAAAIEAERSATFSRLSQAMAPGLERIDSEGAKETAYQAGDVTEEPGTIEERETKEMPIPTPVPVQTEAPSMPVPEPAVANGDATSNGHAEMDSARTSEEYVRVPPTRDIDAEEAAAKRIQRAWRRSQSSDTVKPQITAPVVVAEIIEPPAYSDTEGAAKKIQRAWRRHSSHSQSQSQANGPAMPVPEPVVMPLPPLKDLLVSPSESSGDTVGYAASERTPLLGKTAAPPGRAVDLLDNALGFPTTSPSGSASGSGSRATGVSPSVLGWTEHHLPDLSHTYFHHARMGVTTDIDLRVAGKVEKVQSWMEGSRVGDSEESTRGLSEGRRMEVWVREGKKGAFERWWVDHEWRDVAKDGVRRENDEDLDTAFRYWSYVDSHPAHIQLKPAVVKEASDTLAWARSEAVLPGSSGSNSSVPGVASFTREEVDELQTLLSTSAQSGGAMQTRIVARIMLRAVEWRQRTQRPHKPLPQDVPSSTQHAHVPARKVHFGKSVLDIFVGVSCLGIPFLFLNRNRTPRVHGGLGYGHDMEAGYAMSGPGPTLMVCACSCLTAAIVLSASVTFISLPNLDELARLAALLAILASTASMASTVLALFRYKIDIERTALLPHPFAAGAEGIIGFTKRSVLMSMPLVFLAWAVIAFAAGIGAYAISVGSGPGNGGMRKIAQGVAQWTILCAFGGVVGVVLTGAVFVRQ